MVTGVSHALLVRSEANRRLGNLAAAVADAEQTLSRANAWGHRFAVAAAQRQLATVYAAMGRDDDAAQAQSLADAAYSQLTDVHPDTLVDLMIPRHESSVTHAS